MRNGHIQSAKTELERLQKQGNTAANRRAAEQPADQGNKSRDTPPFRQIKKATPLRYKVSSHPESQKLFSWSAMVAISVST